MGCYSWYREEGPGRAAVPPSPILAVPNVTAHPSTASVPITVLLYDGPLLCCFTVAIKGLSSHSKAGTLRDGAVLLFVYHLKRVLVGHCPDWAKSAIVQLQSVLFVFIMVIATCVPRYAARSL